MLHLDFNRAAFRTATETGDLPTACYSMDHIIEDLLVRNDPLDAVWRESERGLDFVRKADYRNESNALVITVIRAQEFRSRSRAPIQPSSVENHSQHQPLSGNVPQPS